MTETAADPATGRLGDSKFVFAVRALLLVALLGVYARRLGLDPTERFFDDYFYYLKAAANWVDGAGSTFFPGESTNGYHPLWFLWIALLYLIFGSKAVFFAVVDASVTLLMVGFFFAFERFLNRAMNNRIAASVGAAIAVLAITPKALMGMETALVVFAASVLMVVLSRKPLADQNIADAAVAGLLVAFMVLSRLDSVMLAPGMFLVLLPRWDWKRFLAATAGLTPVFAYFAFNLTVYGHVGTTSMEAKSLGFYWPPNWHFISVELPIPGVAEIGTIIAVGAIVALRSRIQNADLRHIALALAATPLLQLIAQALMSGWRLYPWYLYFDFMVMGFAAALLLTQATAIGLSRRIVVGAGVVVLVLASVWFAASVKPDRDQKGIADIARALRSFAATHPGVYAMGDSAGTPAWELGQPMVHLEGLMMSHEFLERISRDQPLQQVFHDYGVNYYVAVRPDGKADADGCLKFLEPSVSQSSPRAPHMAMKICKAPVQVLAKGGLYHIRIYEIDPATGNPR